MRPHRMAMAALLWCQGAMAADALEPGPGDTTTTAACSACHTLDYIVMNSVFLTADAWKAEVTKMRSAFGAPIDDDAAAEITAYLAKHYAVTQKP